MRTWISAYIDIVSRFMLEHENMNPNMYEEEPRLKEVVTASQVLLLPKKHTVLLLLKKQHTFGVIRKQLAALKVPYVQIRKWKPAFTLIR